MSAIWRGAPGGFRAAVGDYAAISAIVVTVMV
jgi:hypothetical protein